MLAPARPAEENAAGVGPVESRVLICHHRGAASVKLSISSQVPPAAGPPRRQRGSEVVPGVGLRRIWQKNVPVTER
jgi:hypothetical protein